jgi:hypothetical protein
LRDHEARVGAPLGAEIAGVDLRRPISDDVRDAIEAALVENELLIFRNQDISSENLISDHHQPIDAGLAAPDLARPTKHLISGIRARAMYLRYRDNSCWLGQKSQAETIRV